jgi:hypothetical protein
VKQDAEIEAALGLGGTDAIAMVRQNLASVRGLQEQEGRGEMYNRNSPYTPPFGPAERPRDPPQTAAEFDQDEQERYVRNQNREISHAFRDYNFRSRSLFGNHDLN